MRWLVCGWICSGWLLLACDGKRPAEPATEGPPSRPPVESALRTDDAWVTSGPPWLVETEHPGLRSVVFEVLGGRLIDQELRLEVRFSNRSDSSFAVAGDLGGQGFRLLDEERRELRPSGWSPNLDRLDGEDGFGPGSERSGWVAFPSPRGDRFELFFDPFESMRLHRRHLTAAVAVSRESRNEGRSSRPRTAGRTAEEAIGQLLLVQSQALSTFDVDAYLSTLDPALRERERELFLHLRPLPMASVDLQRAPGAALRHASGGRLEVEVELRYALEGVPEDNPFVHRMLYSMVREGDDMRVVRIADDVESASGGPPIWRQGELAVHRTNHFLILTDPRLRGDLVELSTDAEAAWASLKRQGLPLDSGYVLHFVARPETFRRLTNHPAALGVAVGRYTVASEGITVDSRAIFVNGPIFTGRRGPSRRIAEDIRRVTITHELVHLVLAEESRAFTPAWLKEGVAVFFSEDLSYDANRRLVQGGLDRFRLAAMTRATSLGQHDATGTLAAAEYLFAGDVVAWLVEQRGREDLLRFYRSYAEVPLSVARMAAMVSAGDRRRVFDTDPVGSLATDLTEAALAKLYDLDLESLESEVKGWLQLRYR